MATISPQAMLDLIKIRRTVRKFDPGKPVSAESLHRVLEAGTWAPYAPYFPQGWQFIALKGSQRDEAVQIITKSKTILKYLRMEYESASWAAEHESEEEQKWKAKAHEFAATLGNAPVVIVGLVPFSDHMSILGHNLGSAWSAVQNMMLQAQAEGLNSGVVTFHSPTVEHQLINFLNRHPDEWKVAFVLNVGYGLEIPEPAPRKEGLFEIRE